MRSTYIVFERCLLLASQLVMGKNTMCVVKRHMYCTRECIRLRQKLLLWRDPSMADILIASHRNPAALFQKSLLGYKKWPPTKKSWLQAYSIYTICVYKIRMSNIHTINPKVGQFNQLSKSARVIKPLAKLSSTSPNSPRAKKSGRWALGDFMLSEKANRAAFPPLLKLLYDIV